MILTRKIVIAEQNDILKPLIENYFYLQSERPKIIRVVKLTRKVIDGCDFVICTSDAFDKAEDILSQKDAPPIIVVGADKSAAYICDVLDRGVFDYVAMPVNSGTLTAVLCRVERYLRCGFVWNPDYNYPYDKETTVLRLLTEKNKDDALALICEMLTQMDIDYTDAIKERFAITKMHLNIINTLFATHEWLSLYLDKEEVSEYTAYVKVASDLIPFYTKLLDSISKLQVNFVPEITNYILNNPENELSLTIVAAKFYYNHSYMSCRFRQTSGMHYNTFVVFVKLCRADYLARRKNLTLPEIATRLCYSDSRHFMTLFKKFQSPFRDYNRRDTTI
ncbi:MAG: AraC family transcriptional regulator [Christensenellaceae bacterium]|nr:AraC family transcriptional regulator [Christensenellaceae bacterium]